MKCSSVIVIGNWAFLFATQVYECVYVDSRCALLTSQAYEGFFFSVNFGFQGFFENVGRKEVRRPSGQVVLPISEMIHLAHMALKQSIDSHSVHAVARSSWNRSSPSTSSASMSNVTGVARDRAAITVTVQLCVFACETVLLRYVVFKI